MAKKGTITKLSHKKAYWNDTLQALLEDIEHEPPLGLHYENAFRDKIKRVVGVEQADLPKAERDVLEKEIFEYVTTFNMLDPLLNDPHVNEIMVNGYDCIYKEVDGDIKLTDIRFVDNMHVMFFIHNIINPLGRYVNYNNPMVDSHLPDGSRINVIIPPIVKQGPIISIRKFLKNIFTIKELLALDSISKGMAEFLNICVKARLNILVAGNTSSGKTTLLNILTRAVPGDERIITIEDSFELQLNQPHVLSLESRREDNRGEGLVTIRDLVRNVLRMRPDRIIVGEVRGEEALDMLQAMNTGHDGSLTTIHANSSRDSLSRLETMCLMAGFDIPVRVIRKQIANALDLIVYLTRFPDGTRKVTQITEVVGMEGDVITTTDLFMFQQTGVNDKGKPVGAFRSAGLRPMFTDKIIGVGFQLPPEIFQSR
jgi:pilus assembly protein CpaF